MALDYQSLFESAPGLYLVLSPELTILTASNAYLQATHTVRTEIVGHHLFEIFPDNPQDLQATGEANLASSLETVRRELRPNAMAVQKYDIQTSEGQFEERFWSPINTPVLDNHGRLRYIIHQVEDVTDFVRLKSQGIHLQSQAQRMEAEIYLRAQQVQEANQRLQAVNLRLSELDQAKTDFFNNVSHEFRTPLTLILGPTEQALSSPDGLSGPELEAVHRNALRLWRLVNNLLDFSSLEAGRMTTVLQATDLSLMTSSLAGSFQSIMNRAGLELKVDCPPLPGPVMVDRAYWEKIVFNLISNAFKYTLQGRIDVSQRWLDGQIVLEVKDTGVGIPSIHLDRVFERFHRIPGKRGRSHEGTGIGLSLVRELVHLHGGRLELESAEGIGSRFRVFIPAGETTASPEEWRQNPSEAVERFETIPCLSEPPREGVTGAGHILVVDDNADMREYLTRLLRPHWSVQVAVDGQVALQSIRDNPPELILSDVMMPHLDGLGLVQALRACEATRALPIVLLSARAGEDSLLAGLDTGADDYLIKPFTANELLARVRTHLGMARVRNKLTNDLRQSNQELEAFSYTVSHDLRAPLRSIDGFSRELLRAYSDCLDEKGQHYLTRVCKATKKMDNLIEDLLRLSRITRSPLSRKTLDLTELARSILGELAQLHPERQVMTEVEEDLTVRADPPLVTVLLNNLLGNAWKFTARQPLARIQLGRSEAGAFYVRDNGTGFDMAYADRLFGAFQRLHSEQDFEGTGVGLATVARVAARHEGRAWAEAELGSGATFYFTLGGAANV